MSSIKEFLIRQRKRFSEHGVESPDLSAELLLAEAMGLKRQDMLRQLLLQPDQNLPRSHEQRFGKLAERRLDGEPVAYILGNKEFYGRSFKVTRDTLIPRPETELLIDNALKHFQGIPDGSFADLGTGSGCIAVTLALELSGWTGLALDKSAGALAVARENAASLGAVPAVSFINADYLRFPFEDESLDLLASNPPYVSEAEHLELMPGVRDFEPKTALVPGPDGSEHFATLARIAKNALRFKGIFLMELGSGQGGKALEILRGMNAWSDFGIIKDLAGLDRLAYARRG